MRDTILKLAAAAGLVAAATALSPAGAAGGETPVGEWIAAGAFSGTPRYGPGFEHFDYVNPDAPKDGTATLGWPRDFDSFNPLLPSGLPAPGLGLLYETLFTTSLDERDISAHYGLVAEAMRIGEDQASVSFRLDPEARWHDGEPIDAEDVIWSFETATEISPQRKFYYRNVTGVEQTGEREVTFTFDQTGNRELPFIVAQFLILPKHWWSVEVDGERRIDQTRLDEVPLGSGPYRIRNFSPGRSITYERVADAWANDHPTRIGHWNFETIAYEVFQEPRVAIEGFKKRLYDWKDVNSAKEWATDYESFDALSEGRVIREEFPDTTSGRMQAFVPNLRRERFRDPRVRRALNLAFDFETTRRTVFYDQYERIGSFFERTELASTGLPEGRELEILREIAARHPDHVPERVFTEPYRNPVAGDTGKLRENLREADRLLREAGWEVVDGKRMKDGEVFTIEYLESSPVFEPIALPWLNNLRRLGFETEYRFVDRAQEVERERSRDFDLITKVWLQSLSPGNEQREFWGSAAADEPGSQNVAGIADPAVDALIERVVLATDREDLVAAVHALDRVMLAKDYVIPQWVSSTDRTLRWDKFGRPDELPEFSNGWPAIWWYDAERAARVEG